jgi:hypothetical protein
MNVILKPAPATTVLAKPATTTGAIFGATPAMPAMFKSNFDYQLVRGMMVPGGSPAVLAPRRRGGGCGRHGLRAREMGEKAKRMGRSAP